jgi:hypothetical protein
MSVLRRALPKIAYAPPTLRRGPVLTAIAAVTSDKKVPVCWVARAAFGEDDIRWMVFRAWLVADAPGWFRTAYIRHGERFGAWLSGKPRARAAVRRAMGIAVRRKLRLG